jgi:hypothetical protein
MKMKAKKEYPYRLVLGEGPKAISELPRSERRVARVTPAKPPIAPQVVQRALKATAGSKELIEQIPALVQWQIWLPVATFSVCQKTGTATFLDIFDADHFDGFTDMKSNLAECRVWFSADGFTFWDSLETKTGRINCYFKAPSSGNYVCNVSLQSYAGPAQVECVIDSSSYGPLPFSGSINQPHIASLSAGYHSFRIRQMSGSFFFVSLSVWKV